MACAGLLLIMLASTTLQISELQISDAVRADREPTVPSRPSPTAPIGKAINLSLPARIHDPAMSMSGAAEFSPPQIDATQAGSSRLGVSLGPLRTEFGGTTGRHMHLATVKLEGVSVFGGSIGGSIDSRSARITLSWPTGN